MFFTYTINGKSDWAAVFQSIPAFQPLVEAIFSRHGLPFSDLTNCTPGTNAVFCVGAYIVKIFAPPESGFSTGEDYAVECFGLSRANALGVPAPRLAAYGTMEDRYRFDYLVMERVPGHALGEITDSLSDKEKTRIGRELRHFTTRMDTPCEPFHTRQLRGASAEARWDCFPEAFRAERAAYLARVPYGAPVYVHGDLTRDNILVTPEGAIRVIDYADALTAPPEVELACVMCEAFQLEKPYLAGFFGTYAPGALAETCLAGLLLHDFGANIVCDRFAAPRDVENVAVLRRLIRERLS